MRNRNARASNGVVATALQGKKARLSVIQGAIIGHNQSIFELKSDDTRNYIHNCESDLIESLITYHYLKFLLT